ncbi:MAG: hypothetical protein KDB03_12145 [Planctomycetales bacterium]|nr:hypothetical protein [Planctomycetales bacterium]
MSPHLDFDGQPAHPGSPGKSNSSQLQDWLRKSPHIQLRVRFFLTGVILPIGCWIPSLLGSPPQTGILWQSGQPSTYASLMLHQEVAWPFWPLIVLSMLAMGAWTIRLQVGRFFPIRMGIYLGTMLALQYAIVVLTIFPPLLIASAIVGGSLIITTWFGTLLLRRSRQIAIAEIMGLTAVVALLATCARFVGGDVWEWFISIPIFVVVGSPILTLLTYFRASIHLLSQPILRSHTSTVALFASALSWFALYAYAWKLSVERLLAEYAKLPPQPPDCFVCSAAACGHPWLVGTNPQDNVRVNRQMQYLKFFEALLKTTVPRTHCRLRQIYNRWGPSVAKTIRGNPWFADTVYLLLLPLTCSAYCCAKLLRIDLKLVSQIYRSRRL